MTQKTEPIEKAQGGKTKSVEVAVEVDTSGLDCAIAKAQQLSDLIRENNKKLRRLRPLELLAYTIVTGAVAIGYLVIYICNCVWLVNELVIVVAALLASYAFGLATAKWVDP